MGVWCLPNLVAFVPGAKIACCQACYHAPR